MRWILAAALCAACCLPATAGEPRTGFGRWVVRVWYVHRDNDLRRSEKRVAAALERRREVWVRLTIEQRRRWLANDRDAVLRHLVTLDRMAREFFGPRGQP